MDGTRLRPQQPPLSTQRSCPDRTESSRPDASRATTLTPGKASGLHRSASLNQRDLTPVEFTARTKSMLAYQPEHREHRTRQPLLSHSQVVLTKNRSRYATVGRFFSRQKQAAPPLPATDYTKKPENLRNDLRLLEGNPEHEEILVRNIKHSIGVLSGSKPTGQRSGEICQQKYILKLFSNPELRLVECDFSSIVALKRALQSSPTGPF